MKGRLGSCRVVTTALLLMTIIMTAGCLGSRTSKEEKPTIVLSETGYDSNRFHNAVAMFIIEKAYGYKVEEVSGSTSVMHEAMKGGDVDLKMEIWSDNLTYYKGDVDEGSIIELGVNYDDNAQGLYVPRYVIEGDEARGIKPAAPDLEYVWDLKSLKHIFPDPEVPGKGRLYGAIPGWQVDKIIYNKYLYYGLDQVFTYFSPGSDAALAAAFASSYEKGEPIVGYYWDPTWLTGKYDLVLLKDAPYDPTAFHEGKCEFPPVRCTVCCSPGLLDKAPDIIDFLKKYRTSSAITAAAMTYISDNQASMLDTAKWFLREYEPVWTAWLDEKSVKAVKAAL